MPTGPDKPRWLVLLAPRWLAWHAFAVVAVTGMLWLGDWQFHRAESGNALSWAYTFEWPIFAVFGVVFWVKTIRDEVRPAGAAAAPRPPVELPPGVSGLLPAARSPDAPSPDGRSADPGEPDPELDEYNAYLARLGTGRRQARWRGWR